MRHCFGDHPVKDNLFPGLLYPRSPGHEVAEVIDEVGANVATWKKGQRVGVGWHGGQDGTCLSCRRGDFGNCARLKITGISFDGGYAEYMIAPIEALASMPSPWTPRRLDRSCVLGHTTYTRCGAMERCRET